MAKQKSVSLDTSEKDGKIREILGVPVFSTSLAEVLGVVAGWVGSGEAGKLIFTPNSEMLVKAVEDEEFRQILRRADLNIPDGIGVVLASRLLGRPVARRVAGTEVVEALLGEARQRGWRVLLLGGQKGEAEAVGEKVSSFKFQVSRKFKVVSDSGPQSVSEMTERENEELLKRINQFKPDLLLVAFGHGKQEKWLLENKERLNVTVGMGVGGAFNYLSGRMRRPPKWMAQVGLEWLWRLVQQPQRWRRQLKLFKFWGLVLGELASRYLPQKTTVPHRRFGQPGTRLVNSPIDRGDHA